MITQYWIAALAAPVLLPDGIQTAQTDRLADETAQFTTGAGRPPSPAANPTVTNSLDGLPSGLNFNADANEGVARGTMDANPVDPCAVTYRVRDRYNHTASKSAWVPVTPAGRTQPCK